MKILFCNLQYENLPASAVSDYQLDMLFHGLVSLGHEVYEGPYHWWMRSKERRPESKDIWGKSFTLYHTLDYEQKIPNGYEKFDLTIIGVHHTIVGQDHRLYFVVNKVLESPEDFGKVIVIDGWDRDYICREVANKVKYFKRELVEQYKDCALPISFAFPEEKIISDEELNKEKIYKWVTARLIPVNQSVDSSYMSTYIYDSEKDYYQMYRNSMFAFTSKKGGWDTLRHYEIIANGCVPLFIGIQNCPPKTLTRFPSHLCIEALTMRGLYFPMKNDISQNEAVKEWTNCSFVDTDKVSLLGDDFSFVQYYRLRERFVKWLREKGTTRALASYVLEESFK